MILDLLHIPIAVAACFALWKLWTSLATRGRASLIIAVGFLIRAFGGEVLFWISYLNLPVARSLQLGDGFWFFAVDGPGMLAYARELIPRGPSGLLLIGRELPSHAFIQIFTTLAWMFGTFASVAILLNCAAFLATCAIILRLGEPGPRGERPRIVALLAMAFGPGTILWSLQLLKDTLFIFLIAAMIACCFSWQEQWRNALINWRKIFFAVGVVLIVLYTMAGIRWYLAVFFWGAWIVFGLLTVLAARRKVAAILANALLLVLLAQAVRLGGASDVPQSIRRILDPRPSIAATFRPTVLTKDLSGRRYGFEKTPGATTIVAGRALEPVLRHGEEIAKQPPMSKTTDAHAIAKTMAGLTAEFLPRSIAQALGLVRIGGGRGFWLFAELDTLVFDCLLIASIILCARRLRTHSRITPLFVLLLIVFLATAGPLAYTVNNFGTLFRLRQMLYAILAFLPLTMGTSAEGVRASSPAGTRASRPSASANEVIGPISQ
jgi:hypothetical protein